MSTELQDWAEEEGGKFEKRQAAFQTFLDGLKGAGIASLKVSKPEGGSQSLRFAGHHFILRHRYMNSKSMAQLLLRDPDVSPEKVEVAAEFEFNHRGVVLSPGRSRGDAVFGRDCIELLCRLLKDAIGRKET